MPFRSMKMKRFICGFHRRVWCPKWTPASSRSFIVISATKASCGVLPPPRRLESRPPRGAGPRRAVGACVIWVVLPLAELEALARARLSVLLALLHARIAREETLAPEQRLQALVLPHERPRDPEADGAGLAGEPTAGYAR